MSHARDIEVALEGLAGAEYVLDAEGQLALTELGEQLIELRQRVDELGRALDRSFVGAGWAALFATHAWLDRLTVKITASLEYGDEGDTYRSFSSAVEGLAFVPGAQVPQDLLCDEQPDAELAADLLEDDLNDLAEDTFLCLEQQQVVEDRLALEVSRERLRGLWESFPVSGLAAFAALFAAFLDTPKAVVGTDAA